MIIQELILSEETENGNTKYYSYEGECSTVCDVIDWDDCVEIEKKPKIDKSLLTPTNFDVIESLELIWDKLHSYRGFDKDECGVKDEEWDDICTAMSWIEDECNMTRIDGNLTEKDKQK